MTPQARDDSSGSDSPEQGVPMAIAGSPAVAWTPVEQSVARQERAAPVVGPEWVEGQGSELVLVVQVLRVVRAEQALGQRVEQAQCCGGVDGGVAAGFTGIGRAVGTGGPEGGGGGPGCCAFAKCGGRGRLGFGVDMTTPKRFGLDVCNFAV